MGSKSRANTQTQTSTTNQQISVGQELQDNALGVAGDNNRISYEVTDHGAMDIAERLGFGAIDAINAAAGENADLARESILSGRDTLDSAFGFGGDIARESILSSRDNLETSLGFSSDVMLESLRTAEGVMNESGINMLDATRIANETAQYSVDRATDAAIDGASMGLDMGTEAMRLISDSNEGSLNFADTQSQRLANTLSDVGAASLAFAESQNERFANTLGDNATMTQQALLELAERQERGLESTLDVAASVAMDDGVEGANTQVKYFALAVAAVGVAWALRANK